jgi:hypothetical protein
MSRGTLRTLFTALVLALALAAAPGEAAGPRRMDPGPSLTDFVPRWLVGLFAKIGLHLDPNGSGGTVTTNGDGGDLGWHIDPNG